MKLNLNIDGNFLLYKTVNNLHRSKMLKPELLNTLIYEINGLMKLYAFDNIYFNSDSKEFNWRKTIYPDYKAKREKDEEIDWKFVFATYNEFKDYVKSIKRIKMFEKSGIEGDDFIAKAVIDSNNEGYSNLILSTDKDYNQLLSVDLNKMIMNFQWNYKYSDEKVYMPENYQLLLEKACNMTVDDIFDTPDNFEVVSFINKLTSKATVVIINKERSLFVKIVWGDKGDNIFSIVKVKAGKIDPKARGIGEEGAEKIYTMYKEIYPEDIDFQSDEFVERLITVTLFAKNVENIDINRDVVRNNILQNRKLILLNEKYMPPIILESFNKYFYDIKDLKIDYSNDDVAKIDIISASDEFIPYQFKMENIDVKFKEDDFWNLL